MHVRKGDTKVIDSAFMEKELEYIKGMPQGIKTGFIDLDYQWRGLKPGAIYLIAARPGMGKTALALNMVQSMAIKGNNRILYFSLEQSKEQLVKRLISLESKEHLDGMQFKNINDEGWNNVVQAARKIGNGNLVINDTTGISIEALDQELSKEAFSDVNLVIIDYLQLIETDYETEHEMCRLTYICEYLKTIAENQGISIVVLSSLSRRPEVRENHRPIISDLDAREIVNCFDNVSFIYRDEYYDIKSECRGIAEIITARNKFGSVGVVNLAWIPEYQKFCDFGSYSNSED